MVAERVARFESAVLRRVLTGVCGYEFVAVTSGRVPTISALVWRGCDTPRWRPPLMALWVLVVAYLTIHLFGGRSGS